MDTTQRAQRISTLEHQLLDVEAELVALHQGRDSNAGLQPPPLPPQVDQTVGSPPPENPPPPQSGDRIEPPAGSGPRPRYAGVELLLRLGGISLVVLSIIFFVSTAISRGWIGPAAQLSLATVTSLAIIGQSFRFGPQRKPWSITFASGGAAALFASGVVGYVGLDLLSFPIAVGWLSGSIAVFLALSRLHDSELLAALSAPALLIGAGLVNSMDQANPELLALVASSYAIALGATTYRQGWSVARTIGVALAAAISSFGLLAAAEGGASLAMISALTAVAAIGVFAAAITQAVEFGLAENAEFELSAEEIIEARFAALSIPWLAFTLGGLADIVYDELWHFGWTIGAVGLIGGLAVTAAARGWKRTMPMLHQLGSLGVVAIASALVFDGPALLTALLTQAIIAGFLADRTRSVDMLAAAAILGAATSMYALGLITIGSLVEALTIPEILAVGAVAVTVAAASWRYRNTTPDGSLWVVGWLGLLGWFAVARLAFPQGDMIVSLLWAGLGTAMIVAGAHLRNNPIVWGGLTTLALTAMKLILVDLAYVDVLWRAGLFLAVGAVFLRLGFVVPELLQRNDDS